MCSINKSERLIITIALMKSSFMDIRRPFLSSQIVPFLFLYIRHSAASASRLTSRSRFLKNNRVMSWGEA